jgi:hypothetical protein
MLPIRAGDAGYDEPPALVLGASGWFTPHGVRYYEERRALDEIAPEDWTAFLDHADRVDFFTRPEPSTASPDARILHLTVTMDGRSRELAINDPFEAPELARLVTLARRCLRDRQVVRAAEMTDEDLAVLRTASSI